MIRRRHRTREHEMKKGKLSSSHECRRTISRRKSGAEALLLRRFHSKMHSCTIQVVLFGKKIGPPFTSLPGGPRRCYGQFDGKMGSASEIKFQGTSRRRCSLSEIKYNCHFAFGRIPPLKPPASSKEKNSKTPEETIHHVSQACIIQE